MTIYEQQAEVLLTRADAMQQAKLIAKLEDEVDRLRAEAEVLRIALRKALEREQALLKR